MQPLLYSSSLSFILLEMGRSWLTSDNAEVPQTSEEPTYTAFTLEFPTYKPFIELLPTNALIIKYL